MGSRARSELSGPTWLIGALLVATVVVVGPASSPVSAATTFTVDTTVDSVDATPGDGTCADAGGDCSLRAAVMEANATAGADIVDLPAGSYVLSLAGSDEDAGATGDLDVDDELQIQGAGSDVTVIDGDDLDRVLDGRAPLTVDDVHVTGGFAPAFFDGDGWLPAIGGGIRAYAGLAFRDSRLSSSEVGLTGESEPGFGAAIAIFDGSGTIERTTIETSGLAGGLASAVWLFSSDVLGAHHDDFSFDEVAVTGNGGIGIEALLMRFPESELVTADVDVIDSVVSANGLGGISISGLENGPHLDVIGSSVIDNGDTGIAVRSGHLDLDRSTVAGNGDGGPGGGGVWIRSTYDGSSVFDPTLVPGPHTVSRSTISGNEAAAGVAWGSAIFADDLAPLVVDHSTIVGNIGTGPLVSAVHLEELVDSAFTGTVVGPQMSGADCGSVVPVSAGGNADSDGTCGFTEPTDVGTVADPLLGPLADNGGLTLTHLPGSSSPLLDAAGACTGTDQRGVSRPQGAACDTGAVEVVPATSVSGTVTEDGTGSPLQGISVRLIDTATNAVRATGTDASGDYSFAGVEAGDYLVRFIDLDGLHTAEYHVDAATKAAAETVAVAGSPVDVDGSLAPDGVGYLRGSVTEVGSGVPLPGVSVRLLSGDGMTLLAGRTTSAAGGYQFSSKAFGSYRMRFIDLDASHVSEWHLDAASRPSSTVISHGAWWTTIDADLAATP